MCITPDIYNFLFLEINMPPVWLMAEWVCLSQISSTWNCSPPGGELARYPHRGHFHYWPTQETKRVRVNGITGRQTFTYLRKSVFKHLFLSLEFVIYLVAHDFSRGTNWKQWNYPTNVSIKYLTLSLWYLK